MSETVAINKIYYRLIALWVVCESFIGGIIHGFKLPFSGLIVGTGSVFCISLIGYYFPKKRAIIKATIIVAIFKLLLSPQAPATAYIAVFFQGLCGQVLFRRFSSLQVVTTALAILSLVESAIQRVLVLTILYGNTLWKAFNEFVSKLTGSHSITNYSMALVLMYVVFHIAWGFIMGRYIFKLITRSRMSSATYTLPIEFDEESMKPIKKRKIKYVFIAIWLLVLGLFLQSYMHWGKPLVSSKEAVQILLRSIFIVLTWTLLLNPLLLGLLKKTLARYNNTLAAELQQVSALLPEIKYIVRQSWNNTYGLKGLTRIRRCTALVLRNTLLINTVAGLPCSQK